MELEHEKISLQLWDDFEKLRRHGEALENMSLVLGLVFLRYLEVRGRPGIEGVRDQGRPLGKALDEAACAIDGEYRCDIFPKSYHEVDDGILRDALVASALLKEGDSFADIYLSLLRRFFATEVLAKFFTPPAIARLTAEILSPIYGRILDPACGIGGLLCESAKNAAMPQVSLCEQSAVAARICRMSLAIHGISDIRRHCPDDRFDLVLCNPLFADRPDQTSDNLCRRTDYLWLDLCRSALAEKGRAAVVMAPSSGDSPGAERELRKKLVQEGIVDAVVEIGRYFFYDSGTPCTLWFLDNDKPHTDRKETILFVDARSYYWQQRDRSFLPWGKHPHRELTPGQIEFIANIVRLYHKEPVVTSKGSGKILEELFPGRRYVDVPGLCAEVNAQEVAGEDWSLHTEIYVSKKSFPWYAWLAVVVIIRVILGFVTAAAPPPRTQAADQLWEVALGSKDPEARGMAFDALYQLGIASSEQRQRIYALMQKAEETADPLSEPGRFLKRLSRSPQMVLSRSLEGARPSIASELATIFFWMNVVLAFLSFVCLPLGIVWIFFQCRDSSRVQVAYRGQGLLYVIQRPPWFKLLSVNAVLGVAIFLWVKGKAEPVVLQAALGLAVIYFFYELVAGQTLVQLLAIRDREARLALVVLVLGLSALFLPYLVLCRDFPLWLTVSWTWLAFVALPVGLTTSGRRRYGGDLKNYARFLAGCRKDRDERGEAGVCADIGNIWATLGKHKKAVKHYRKSLEIWRRLGDRVGIATTAAWIGRSHQALGQYQKALEHYLLARENLEQSENPPRLQLAGVVAGVGRASEALGREDEALQHYCEALQLLEQCGVKPGESVDPSFSLEGIRRCSRKNGTEEGYAELFRKWESVAHGESSEKPRQDHGRQSIDAVFGCSGKRFVLIDSLLWLSVVLLWQYLNPVLLQALLSLALFWLFRNLSRSGHLLALLGISRSKAHRAFWIAVTALALLLIPRWEQKQPVKVAAEEVIQAIDEAVAADQKNVVPLLTDILNHALYYPLPVTQHVLAALGRLGDDKVLPQLLPFLASPHRDIQKSAIGAVRQITERSAAGEPMGKKNPVPTGNRS